MEETQYNYQDQMVHKPKVKAFFHKPSFTFSYVVTDPSTQKCAIIDSVLDFDLPSATLSHESAAEIIQYVQDEGLTVEWHLETHMHADHLSAAAYLKEKLGGRVAIGNHIADVQSMYQDVFNVSETELANARMQFALLAQFPRLRFTPPDTHRLILYTVSETHYLLETHYLCQILVVLDVTSRKEVPPLCTTQFSVSTSFQKKCVCSCVMIIYQRDEVSINMKRH